MEILPDYKKQAAAEALKLISESQVIGLGAGSSVSHLVDMIAGDKKLASSIICTSSSFTTINRLKKNGLNVQPPDYFKSIDIYFDGCDQFDSELNALKSGGGIHTTEKILASMAKEFVLIGDSEKMTDKLNAKYPLVIEILPPALTAVMGKLTRQFPEAVLNLRNSSQKDGVLISDYGNYLLDVKFNTLPELKDLNNVKMIPGIVDHSLFYKLATSAIIAGPNGISIIKPG